MDTASPTYIYEAGTMEQMVLLSCTSTRKQQAQRSGGGGGRLDDQCSSPLGMQRPVHTPGGSAGTAHGPADTPLGNSKARSNPQLSGDSREYSSSQFTFQVVDSTQNKNTKWPQIAHTVTHILSQLNTSKLRYTRSIHNFDWHYFNKDLGKEHQDNWPTALFICSCYLICTLGLLPLPVGVQQ